VDSVLNESILCMDVPQISMFHLFRIQDCSMWNS